VPPQERDGNVVLAGSDLRIIEQLTGQAFVTQQQKGGLVLGLSSAEGAKAMVDTALGKVRLKCDRPA